MAFTQRHPTPAFYYVKATSVATSKSAQATVTVTEGGGNYIAAYQGRITIKNKGTAGDLIMNQEATIEEIKLVEAVPEPRKLISIFTVFAQHTRQKSMPALTIRLV